VSRYEEGSDRMEYDVYPIYRSLGQNIDESTFLKTNKEA
jgi:hypothetical protein